MTTVSVIPIPELGGNIGGYDGLFGGIIAAAADGTIPIDSRDLSNALAAGFVRARRATQTYSAAIAPAAALATAYASGVALANGALALAAVPEIMRQVVIAIIPGNLAITAGVLTVVYPANDGTVQTDVFSLITPLSTTLTVYLSKPAVLLTTAVSAVVSGLVGGNSPTINIGRTAVIGVPLPQGAVDVTLLSEIVDAASETKGTLTNAGFWTPTTAPNATHTFAAVYSTVSP